MTIDTQARELLAAAYDEAGLPGVGAWLRTNPVTIGTPYGVAIRAISSALSCSPLSGEDAPVFTFLLGEGDLDGCWFSDKHPTERGNFWWRRHLRAALSHPSRDDVIEECAKIADAFRHLPEADEATAISVAGRIRALKTGASPTGS